MNKEALSKLDKGFDEVRETVSMDAKAALNLVGTAIRCAEQEQDTEIAKERIQRVYGLSNEIMTELDIDFDCEEIKLSKSKVEAVQQDIEGNQSNVVPLSAAIAALQKRFGTKGEKKEDTEEVEKRNKSNDYASITDLNSQDFDAGKVDWGPDPDWSAVK